jgi:hypothetical protein
MSAARKLSGFVTQDLFVDNTTGNAYKFPRLNSKRLANGFAVYAYMQPEHSYQSGLE